MLLKTGERQVATHLEEVREDHKERYWWACSHLSKTEKVFDAGCGAGYGAFLLAEQALSVYAVDVSAEAIAHARRYWVRSNITYDVQDLHSFELPRRSSFDAVVAFEVIEHLLEPRLFLQRIKKYLRHNGRLFLSVPNEKEIPHTIELNPFHIRHYTSEEVKNLLRDCGYEVNTFFSQNAKEVTPGTSGKFLILVATQKPGKESQKLQSQLCKSALTIGGAQIVARSTALVKTKKEVQSLKLRLDEAKKMAEIKLQDSKHNEYINELKNIHFVHFEEKFSSQRAQFDQINSELKEQATQLSLEKVANQQTKERFLEELERLRFELRAEESRAKENEVLSTILKRDQDSKVRQIFDLEEALDNAREAKASLVQKLSIAITELNALKNDFATNKAAHEYEIISLNQREGKWIEESRELQNQIESYQSKLEKSFREQESQACRIANLEHLFGCARKSKATIAQKLDSALAEYNSLKSDFNARQAGYESELSSAHQRETFLVKELSDGKKQVKRLQEVLRSQVENFNRQSRNLQEELTALKEDIANRNNKIFEQESQLFNFVKNQKAETDKFESLLQKVEKQNKQLGDSEKNLLELQEKLNMAKTEIDAGKKELSKTNGHSNHLSIKILALASENDVLRKTNESLSLELENVKFHKTLSPFLQEILPKEPPSLGYMWRKLKFHHFYGPFIGRAIRNSLGLNRVWRKSFPRLKP